MAQTQVPRLGTIGRHMHMRSDHIMPADRSGMLTQRQTAPKSIPLDMSSIDNVYLNQSNLDNMRNTQVRPRSRDQMSANNFSLKDKYGK